jgi:hypothetical protein
MPNQDSFILPIPTGQSLVYFDHSIYDGVDILQRMTIFKGKTLKSHARFARAGEAY